MERSNVRDHISLEENEANLRTLQTIHSIDEVYKTYVPKTVAKQINSQPPLALSNPNSESATSQNGIRSQNPNLAALVSSTTLQNSEISAPRAQFSNLFQNEFEFGRPLTTTLKNNPQKDVFDQPAHPKPRIASGQMNRQGGKCSLFDSSQNGGATSLGGQSTCVTAPEMHIESYYSQDPSYTSYCCCSGYCDYPFQRTTDQYQELYPSDLGIDFCCCPQSSIPLVQTSAQGDDCCGSVSQSRSSVLCCSTSCSDNDQCSESSARSNSKSLDSKASTKPVCCPDNKYSDRALKMPDPEERKVRIEMDSNCSAAASSQRSSSSRFTEECAPSCPDCSMDGCLPTPNPCCPPNCFDIESFLRAQAQQACYTNQCCCVNDVLQNYTVYTTDYRPIMGMSHQFPGMGCGASPSSGGCCCEDMLLGGGFGASSCPSPCPPSAYCPMSCGSCGSHPCDPNPCCYPPDPSCCGAGLCGGHSAGIYMNTPCCYPLGQLSPRYSTMHPPTYVLRPTVFH